MRRASKIDANHNEIVTALRAVGCFVQSLAAIGKGTPDVLAIYKGTVHLLEIKDGKKPQSSRELTDAENEWHNAALVIGHYRVPIVTSIDDALKAVGAVD